MPLQITLRNTYKKAKRNTKFKNNNKKILEKGLQFNFKGTKVKTKLNLSEKL